MLTSLYDLLGNAHVHLSGNRTENLRKAVAYLEKALGALPGDAPDNLRALSLHNLGNATECFRRSEDSHKRTAGN